MAHKTNFLETELLDHVLRNAAYTGPTTWYVALFSTAPTDAYTSGTPTGTEVSWTDYARIAVTFGAPSGTPRACANTNEILFDPKGSAGTVNVVAFGIFDASSAGNLLYWNTITTLPVAENQQVRFAIGNLIITED